MRVTFILSNLTEDFYERFLPAQPGERLDYLLHMAKGDLRHNVKCKIGTGQFRDAVEFNALKRSLMNVACEGPLSRRGYKLFIFNAFKA